jgi:hypothetical protein
MRTMSVQSLQRNLGTRSISIAFQHIGIYSGPLSPFTEAAVDYSNLRMLHHQTEITLCLVVLHILVLTPVSFQKLAMNL